MMAGALTVLLTSVLITAAPAQAATDRNGAVPGDSAIDQYLESIPDGAGNKPFGDRDGAEESGQQTLPPAVAAEIDETGSLGPPLVEFVESTAPPEIGGSRSRSSPDAKNARRPTESPDSRGDNAGPVPTAAAGASVGDDGAGGMGAGLPILLVAAFVATIIMRRRRPGPRTRL